VQIISYHKKLKETAIKFYNRLPKSKEEKPELAGELIEHFKNWTSSLDYLILEAFLRRVRELLVGDKEVLSGVLKTLLRRDDPFSIMVAYALSFDIEEINILLYGQKNPEDDPEFER